MLERKLIRTEYYTLFYELHLLARYLQMKIETKLIIQKCSRH